MQDEIQNQRVVSLGGLNTLNNYLTLSLENPGAAVVLQNFESSLAGGYRRINGIEELEVGFSEVTNAGSAEGPVLAVLYFFNTSTQEYELMAARKDTGVDTYSIYQYSIGVGWAKYVTGLTLASEDVSGLNTVTQVRYAVYGFGDANRVMFVDGVNHAYYYDGTSWYDVDPAGTGLSDANAGGAMALAAPSVISEFKGHIFVSGDPNQPGVVAHCAPRTSYDWLFASGAGQLIYGFEVVQIKPFRDALYTWGQTSIKKVVLNGTDFVFEDVTQNLGCVAPDSVVEINGYLLFMSHDGIRPIAGTERNNDVELSLISQEIQDLIDDAEANYDFANLKSIVLRGKTQFRYFFSDDTDEEEEGAGVIGCFRNDRNGQRWEFMSLLGFRTSCTWSGVVGNRERAVHGNYDGKVYVHDTGISFAGRDITAIYVTPYIDLGNTEIYKTFHELNIFIKGEGAFVLNTAVTYDWGNEDAINPPAYSSEISSSTTYDSGLTYDGGAKYGGEQRSIFDIQLQGQGRSIQYAFSSNGQTASYTIHGFVHEFAPHGRQS